MNRLKIGGKFILKLDGVELQVTIVAFTDRAVTVALNNGTTRTVPMGYFDRHFHPVMSHYPLSGEGYLAVGTRTQERR